VMQNVDLFGCDGVKARAARAAGAAGAAGRVRSVGGQPGHSQRGARLSMKACTPSSATDSIMLPAMVRFAAS